MFDRWTQAKAEFDKSKALFSSVPQWVAHLNKVGNLVPMLKAFDKAEGYEARHKAMLPLRTAKQAYDKEIRVVFKLIKDAKKEGTPAYKALDKFEKALAALIVEADKLAQPPRPGGGTVPHEVLRGFNLANGFKPKNLDLQATRVDVIIEIDKTLDEMIKKGQESLKIDHLGEVAKSELDKVAGIFSKTMEEVDAKIGELDSKRREAKIKEANEVLKHYARIVEDRLVKVVDKEWKDYLGRKQYLKDFRTKCVTKVVLGSVAVAVSVTSAVMSFGALWMNVVAAVKAISDITQTLKTWSEDLDKVYGLMLKDIDAIHQLNQQREAAKKKGEGQKASKARHAAKEVLTGVLPITKNMVRSASSVEDRAKQLLGLVSKLEDQANVAVGYLNQTIKDMSKLPEKQMTPALRADADKINQTVKKLFAEIQDMHRRSQNCAHFGQRALMEAKKLRVEDLWTGSLTAETMGMGTKGVAIYALANFCLETAKHGTTLLSLL